MGSWPPHKVGQYAAVDLVELWYSECSAMKYVGVNSVNYVPKFHNLLQIKAILDSFHGFSNMSKMNNVRCI